MSTPVIEYKEVLEFVDDMLGSALHSKQCVAIANTVLGACRSDRLGIAAVGRAMAVARGMSKKHGIKQVDRYLSNRKIDIPTVFFSSVPWIVGDRKDIVVAMDWTEYAKDGHSVISLNLLTNHGRATPLVWMTVPTEELKNRRNLLEDTALHRLKEALPRDVHVTILADRGFGDAKLYQLIRDKLEWDFVIRFRGCVYVRNAEGEVRKATDWVPSNGQVRVLRGATVTGRGVRVGAVVCVKKAGMKDEWCLATSLAEGADRAVELYMRRFTIEETFRDEKDRRFGMGLLETSIGDPGRRDRFLLIAMLTIVLLTLLGAAGEGIGLDRDLRANTETRRRTHSLFRQGREYIAGVTERVLCTLRAAFHDLLRQHGRTVATYALI